jgi:single-stranded DNA-binding protein
MISILTTGTLIARPAACTSRNGNNYVRCQLRANAGDESFLVSLVAFDEGICKALLALDKGDSVSVTGTGKPSTWTGRDNEPCLGLNVKVEQLMTQYSLTKKRAASRGDSAQYGLPAVGPLSPTQRDVDDDGTAPF